MKKWAILLLIAGILGAVILIFVFVFGAGFNTEHKLYFNFQKMQPQDEITKSFGRWTWGWGFDSGSFYKFNKWMTIKQYSELPNENYNAACLLKFNNGATTPYSLVCGGIWLLSKTEFVDLANAGHVSKYEGSRVYDSYTKESLIAQGYSGEFPTEENPEVIVYQMPGKTWPQN